MQNCIPLASETVAFTVTLLLAVFPWFVTSKHFAK